MTKERREELLDQICAEMKEATRNLEFERAAQSRDEIARIEKR